MKKIIFIGLNDDAYDNYYINLLVNGKKADILLQGKEQLNDFLGYNWDENVSTDQIENGMQTRLNEIADNIDLTKLENFEYKYINKQSILKKNR